ncbi:PREDICTED: uncharacterized protein LOC106309153 [Brassica oleracea var. oleracea]|uniref:uncharacterized protein LOC106309153 n=1 Tax=Brassica oleracea var. oleracea TaxID=109376 RepID=UPI0006A72E48|nr:PREDICTED: uncharacterized protein LOC106309153 [Brassica oleracea var. oleracea]
MGEAKILVEVELDKPFPKLIALDDKQGNIYLVDVEYSWIPSACGRCGALGYKEKRCLLPQKPLEALSTKETQGTGEEIPIVDIVKLLQNTSSTHADHLEPKSLSPSSHQVGETPIESYVTTPSEVALASSLTHSHEIMEEIPSPIIILEGSGASENEQPIGPSTPLTRNHQQFHMEPEIPLSYGKEIGVDVVGETSSYNLTRGGRPIKPTQKIQDMEWMKVSGKGKHGRRGRGNHIH